MIRPPSISTLFPYTTLFRSHVQDAGGRLHQRQLFGPDQRLRLLGERHVRSEEHTSELQSLRHLVCRLLLEKKKIAIHRGPASSRNRAREKLLSARRNPERKS